MPLVTIHNQHVERQAMLCGLVQAIKANNTVTPSPNNLHRIRHHEHNKEWPLGLPGFVDFLVILRGVEDTGGHIFLSNVDCKMETRSGPLS
jgi:hypothetical protein